MQLNSGLYRALSSGLIYRIFQSIVGGQYPNTWLAENVWKCSAGDKILDIGCGTCEIIDYLPSNIDYCGLDLNENYIALAKKHYGKRGKFYVSDVKDFGEIEIGNKYDLIICNGLFHHINDDEAIKVLKSAKSLMHEKSRLICVDNCYLLHQTFLSRWIISKDRGRNIRSESELKQLFSQVFSNFKTNIVTGLLRIPYVHIIIECSK